eukprot:UC1_evm3s191
MGGIGETSDGWRRPLLVAVVIGVVVVAGVTFHAAGGSKTNSQVYRGTKPRGTRPGVTQAEEAVPVDPKAVSAAKAEAAAASSKSKSQIGAAKVAGGGGGGGVSTEEEGDGGLDDPVPEEQLKHLPLLEAYLEGEPKSGTTWMELVINDMISKYKELGMCGDCFFEGEVGDTEHTLHEAHIVHGGYLFTDFSFNRKMKHKLPLADGEYANTKGSQSYKLPSKDYKDCIKFYQKNAWSADAQCPSMKPPVLRPDVRYVNIVRDPRALIVSGAHYFKKKLDKYIKKAALGIMQRTALRYHWFDKRISPKMALVVHYHTIKENPLFEYQRIASFLGLPLSKTHISEVMDMTSVEAMHNMEVHHELPHKNSPGKDTAKVRSGTVDEFRDEIKGKQMQYVNQLMVDNMPEELVREFFNEDDMKLVKFPKSRR